MGPNAGGPESLVGNIIGGYQLESIIGDGGSGVVYLGRRATSDASLPERAALKVLKVFWFVGGKEQEQLRARFRHEVETWQRLRHPHILPVLSSGEENGLPYIVLAYAEGKTLAERIARSGSHMPLAQVAQYLAQIADALDYAHAQGVIHRDIKPANVLLDGADNAYLTDFSIAKMIEGTRTTLTSRGVAVGTPDYMSPEQMTTGQAGPASDIYSLGVLLFELVTGQRPFEADNLVALIHMQTQEPPPLPRMLRPDLPAAAEAALLKALEKQPAKRFQSAGALARAFAAGLEDRYIEGVQPIIVPPRAVTPTTTESNPVLPETVASQLPQTTSTANARKGASSRTLAFSGLAVLLIVSAMAVLLNGLGRGSHSTTVTRATSTPGGSNPSIGSGGSGTASHPAKSTSTSSAAPTATPTPIPVVDQAQVSNSGTGERNPGDSFSVTFTATNSGTTTWSPGAGYALVCVANCYGAGTQTLSGNVAPGQSATFNVGMTAPNGGANILNQNYSQSASTWQMQHNGTSFGNQSSATVATHGWTTAYGPTTPCAGSNGWAQIKQSAGCGSLQTTSAYYPEMDLQGWLVSNTGQFRMETHMNMTANNSGNYEPGLIIDTPQAPAFGGAEFGTRANGTWTVWKCCSGNIPVVVKQAATSPSTSHDLAVVVSGGTAHFYIDGNEVWSTATGNLNLSGNEQGVIQWWNVQSSNDTSNWSNFQLANWG